MTRYTVSFWSGRQGDVEMKQEAHSAAEAIAIAERGGSPATILADETSYTVDEFKLAVEGGEFK